MMFCFLSYTQNDVTVEYVSETDLALSAELTSLLLKVQT